MAMTALLSNVMSLLPKFDEVREAITDANYDLAFLTETWLRDRQSSNAFSISGYNFFRRDRSKDLHGGVCIYIKDSIKYEVLDDLSDERLEAIWIFGLKFVHRVSREECHLLLSRRFTIHRRIKGFPTPRCLCR